jgi:hypothetical protein
MLQTTALFRGGEWNLVNMIKSNRTGSKYTYWKDPKGPTSPQYLHLGYMGRQIAIDTNLNPVGTVYVPLLLVHFISGAQLLQLKDGYCCPSESSCSQETFDAFVDESASKTATVFQVTTSKSDSVKEGGVKWLQSLGVKKFRYMMFCQFHNGSRFNFVTSMLGVDVNIFSYYGGIVLFEQDVKLAGMRVNSRTPSYRLLPRLAHIFDSRCTLLGPPKFNMSAATTVTVIFMHLLPDEKT